MSIIETIKESWGWVGIEPEEVVGENDFGNLIIRDIRGQYWRLCPEDVYCKVVARNREELDELSRNQEFLADWYMLALTEVAREKLGPLAPGRKYHLAIPGVLGGAYAISNIKTIPQIEQIEFSGHIGKHLEELPEGLSSELCICRF